MAEQKKSKKLLWLGRVLSVLGVLFLLFDTTIHLLNPSQVIEASKMLGYASNSGSTFGILELICLAFYIFPKTKILGAILLTGYLGGAVASNFRVGNPLFSHTLFPVYIGLFIWGGLFFRDKRVQSFIPYIK